MAGLYIHIPFCASRCIYCDFYSTTGRNRTLFIDRLLEELSFSKPHSSFLTIYLGGGTPSQLSSEELNQLVEGLSQQIDLNQVEEFTMEMNPEDVTPAYVAAMPRNINRVSMGVQSFVENELRMLRRRHDAQRPAEAVKLLRTHGISNISIDLMYGLPGQTLESFNESISRALSLQVEHISAYCLSVEEGTELHRRVERGELTPADDDLCNQMNALLRTRLREAGYVQYEISNYALPGFESRHNSSYWDGTPYLGLGPGAHSYDGDRIRSWNESDLTAYLNGQRPRGSETLSDEDRYNERIMLSLRTRKGVNTNNLQKCFPSHFQSTFLPNIAELVAKGWIQQTADNICLSPQGLDMADEVIRRLMI